MARLRRLLVNLGEGWFQLRQRFPAGLLDEIAVAVADGERTHRGEVRLVVESRLSPLAVLSGLDAPTRARQLFGQFGIWDTEHNNGVLLYVLLAEHRIEVVADRGIARHVAPGEWAEVCAHMR
ncbi:MAG TPA: TPM domain-containing protein, partial [Rhodanobacter sp.]